MANGRGCLRARRQNKAHRSRRYNPGRPQSQALAPGDSHPRSVSLAHHKHDTAIVYGANAYQASWLARGAHAGQAARDCEVIASADYVA